MFLKKSLAIGINNLFLRITTNSKNIPGARHSLDKFYETIRYYHSSKFEERFCRSHYKKLKYDYGPIQIRVQHFENFVPTQTIFRYKNTESTTTSKGKFTAKETIDHKTIKNTTTTLTPLTKAEKLKKAVKEYGLIVVVFHVGISLLSLGICYLLVASGLDVAKFFATLKLDDWLKQHEIASSAGTFVVAYGIHKVFAPIRIGITLTSVPLVVRYLRKNGFLKK